MKRHILFLAFLLSIKCGLCQVTQLEQERTISIRDRRDEGVKNVFDKVDTSVAGFHDWDISVSRILMALPMGNNKTKAYNEYVVCFYKTAKHKLENYRIIYPLDEDYTEASSVPAADSGVAITLFNSKTKKRKDIKLEKFRDGYRYVHKK